MTSDRAVALNGAPGAEFERLAGLLDTSAGPEDGDLSWIVRDAQVAAALTGCWSSRRPDGGRDKMARRHHDAQRRTGEIATEHTLLANYRDLAAVERRARDAVPAARFISPAVEEYGLRIGIDLERERDLLWIAHEGASAPLPFNWRVERDADGALLYCYSLTGRKQTKHPYESYYQWLVRDRRRWRKKLAPSASAEEAPPSIDALRKPPELLDLLHNAGDALCGDSEKQVAVAAAPRHLVSRYPTEELMEIAPLLGLDPVDDANLQWLVSDFLDEPLPPGWMQHQDESGRIFFFDHVNFNVSEEHPLCEIYSEKARNEKAKKRAAEGKEISQDTKNEGLAWFARALKLDPSRDKDLMWIAKEAMEMAVPKGWCRRTISETGQTYYFNYITNVSSWIHPSVLAYREMAHVAKQDRLCDEIDYMTSLGIGFCWENELAWVAIKSLAEALPSGWCRGVNHRGYAFYRNATTGETTWEHPLKEQHERWLERERKLRLLRLQASRQRCASADEKGFNLPPTDIADINVHAKEQKFGQEHQGRQDDERGQLTVRREPGNGEKSGTESTEQETGRGAERGHKGEREPGHGQAPTRREEEQGQGLDETRRDKKGEYNDTACATSLTHLDILAEKNNAKNVQTSYSTIKVSAPVTLERRASRGIAIAALRTATTAPATVLTTTRKGDFLSRTTGKCCNRWFKKRRHDRGCPNARK